MLFIKSGYKSEKNDEELISEYRSTRDSFIIGILFERYSHLVFAVSMKYLKNEENSKDVVIQVFEKLPSDLVKYDIHNFSSWLHTVTKNNSLRFLSKSKNSSVDAESIPEKAEDDEENFEDVFLPLLEESIRSLNNEQKICIELFYIQKLSYHEISKKTNYSMNEVKSYIQNGKRNLKIILLKKANDKK